MADMIQLRKEPRPQGDIEILSEGAREVVFRRDDKKTTVAAEDVVALRHGDTPAELDHALERMEKGDFKAAERLLAPLEKSEGWVRAHAGFHRANARRLRAELEDAGHDQALALLKAWREREGEHFLAPLAAIVTADAALAAKDFELARTELTRLATYGERAALTSRLGLARVQLAHGLAAGKDPTEALAALEAVEKEGVAAADLDVALLARITRAAGLGKKAEAHAGLELLAPLLDAPAVVRSHWLGAALNTVAELIADLAGRTVDGAAKPQARIAAQQFVNRAVRYTSSQPLERARTLALATEANTLAGRHDIALLMKTELVRRFPGSTYAKAL